MLLTTKVTQAATAGEINASVDATLDSFYHTVKDGKKLIADAKGVLVFPNVYKAGVFLVGGEYGEGALRVAAQTVDYYSTASGAFGWQLGAQKKAIIILFMQDDVLNNFRVSSNWKVGVDASIAVITVGADGSLDSDKLNKPIIAFVIDQKGLMYNLTLEGSKITKLKR
jgi:lipid-binding SYLF domain-containing protein